MRAKRIAQGKQTDSLACTTNWLVISVENDTDFVHETDLFFIVAFEVASRCASMMGRSQVRVDLGKEVDHIFGGDGLGGCGGTHGGYGGEPLEHLTR